MDKIDRKEFVGVLKKVIAGIDSTDNYLLEGSDCFIFDNDWIRSYNNKLSVGVRFPIGIQGAVMAVDFFKLVNKMKGDQIRLSVKKDNIFLTDGRTTLEMSKMSDNFVKDKISNFDFEDMKWKKLPEDFLLGCKLCVFSAAAESFGALNGVCFNGEKIISIDKYRASLYKLEKVLPYFVLSKQSLLELLKFEELDKFCLEENWIHFKNKDNVFFSSRLLEYSFPETVEDLFGDTDSILKDKKNSFSFPKGFRETIERVSLFSFENEAGIKYIQLEIEDDVIVCKGGKQFGKVVEKVKIKKSFSEKVKIKIRSDFLLDILQISDCLNFRENMVIFHSENYFHIISLLVDRSQE